MTQTQQNHLYGLKVRLAGLIRRKESSNKIQRDGLKNSYIHILVKE